MKKMRENNDDQNGIFAAYFGALLGLRLKMNFIFDIFVAFDLK